MYAPLRCYGPNENIEVNATAGNFDVMLPLKVQLGDDATPHALALSLYALGHFISRQKLLKSRYPLLMEILIVMYSLEKYFISTDHPVSGAANSGLMYILKPMTFEYSDAAVCHQMASGLLPPCVRQSPT